MTWWDPSDMGDHGAVVGCWGHGGTLGMRVTLETQLVAGDMEDPEDPEYTVGLWGHRRPWGHSGVLETQGGMVGRWGHSGTLGTQDSLGRLGHATACLHSM